MRPSFNRVIDTSTRSIYLGHDGDAKVHEGPVGGTQGLRLGRV